MANQWFKFYGAEYLSDPKMDRLSVQERSCWITLLCMASQNDGKIKFLSVESLLTKSGVEFDVYDSSEWDNAQNVLQNFEKYEMIKIDSKGIIEIINWEKRQEHNLTVNERVAKSRAKKRSVTINVTNVTSEENRIEENRIEENNSNMSKTKFQKPSFSEVNGYCSERSNKVDPQQFMNFYESNGWKVGKNSMKDWRAAVRTWEKNSFSKSNYQGGKTIDALEYYKNSK